jgi:hypothetical protein
VGLSHVGRRTQWANRPLLFMCSWACHVGCIGLHTHVLTCKSVWAAAKCNPQGRAATAGPAAGRAGWAHLLLQCVADGQLLLQANDALLLPL